MSDKQFILDAENPNDVIDLNGELNVSIKKLKPTEEREFRIQIEGDNIDNSIINAIRRTILMNIPIYGFHRSNIFVEVDKSRNMYNNDLIYNQIESLPIFDVPNNFDLENPEIFLSNDVLKNLFGNFKQEKYIEDKNEYEEEIIDADKKLFKIEMSINVKNNTGTDKFVSSHDAILKIDGKTSNGYMLRQPICLLVLKPSEELSLRAVANLGISRMNAIYEATTSVIFNEITPTKFVMWYKSLGQLDNNIIFTKACAILAKKLEHLSKFISKNYEEDRDPSEIIEIELHGEEHTMGNLLATILQKCKYVKKAAYKMSHPFKEEIIISYIVNEKSSKKPIRVLLDCIKYLIQLFNKISALANK